jgi:hypothetical protein
MLLRESKGASAVPRWSGRSNAIFWIGCAALGVLSVVSALVLRPDLLWRIDDALPGVHPNDVMTALAETKSAEVSASDKAALQRFRVAVAQTVAMHAPQLDAVTQEAGASATQWHSLAHLLALLARDRLDHKHRADAYLDETIGEGIVNPALHSFTDDLALRIDTLQHELDVNTVQLAVDLAAPAPATPYLANRAQVGNDFQVSLYRPEVKGVSVATVAVFGVFDAAAMAGIASRVFARQVVRLGASAAISQLDGPLPGPADILAILGALWTAVDVVHSKHKFSDQLESKLSDGIGQARTAALDDTERYGQKLLLKAQRAQAAIRAAAGSPISNEASL